MHSPPRCACLISTWCPRQGWKLHPRTARAGSRQSPALQPQGYKPHTILPPPHTPGHCPSPLQCSPSLSITRGPQTPRGPSQPHCRAGCELGNRLFQPLLLPQPPPHDLFNPKLSSHKYTSLMAGNLLFLCCSPASQRGISSSSSPQLFLPAPPRYSRHAEKSAAA